MELIDRRGFLRGFLFGTAGAAAALTVSAETLQAMPLDDHAPGALDDWIMKAQAVVVRPVPRRRPRRRGVAGGIEAAASAVGAGCDLTNTL